MDWKMMDLTDLFDAEAEDLDGGNEMSIGGESGGDAGISDDLNLAADPAMADGDPADAETADSGTDDADASAFFAAADSADDGLPDRDVTDDNGDNAAQYHGPERLGTKFRCWACGGTGASYPNSPFACSFCGGLGWK